MKTHLYIFTFILFSNLLMGCYDPDVEEYYCSPELPICNADFPENIDTKDFPEITAGNIAGTLPDYRLIDNFMSPDFKPSILIPYHIDDQVNNNGKSYTGRTLWLNASTDNLSYTLENKNTILDNKNLLGQGAFSYPISINKNVKADCFKLVYKSPKATIEVTYRNNIYDTWFEDPGEKLAYYSYYNNGQIIENLGETCK